MRDAPRDAAARQDGGARSQAIAVIGSMMPRTSVTVVAGNPLKRACMVLTPCSGSVQYSVTVEVLGAPAPAVPGFGEPIESTSSASWPIALPACTIALPTSPISL